VVTVSSPALAQRTPSRAWIDIDDTFVTPTGSVQSYSTSQKLFDEIGTASVTYPTATKARVPAFGAVVQIVRGFGVGVRVASVERQTMPAAITLTLPDPVFFGKPHTGNSDTPLQRTERTMDLSAVYVVPMPSRLAVRVFAGRSRVHITQSLIDHITYKYPDVGGAVTIVNVTQQTADGYAWGSVVGLNAGVFLLRNVGVGIEVVRRHVEIPEQSEPFSAGPFTLSPHRTTFAAGLRLRF